MKNIALAFAFLLVLPFTAVAQTAPSAAPEASKYPVLEKIRSQAAGGGKDFAFDYMGQRFGMDAWMISGKGVMQIVFTDPKTGAGYLGGLLIGPDGKETNSDVQNEFIKQNPERARDILINARGMDKDAAAKTIGEGKIPPVSNADALWNNLDHLGVVTFGAGNVPVVYAILDPAQAESKLVSEKLSVLAEKGEIVLKVAPLAIQSADSIMPIAQVLGSENPPALWKALLAGDVGKLPESPDAKGVMALKDNVTFAQGLNLRTLPFIVYRQGGKGTVRAVKGLPKNWDVLVKDIGLNDEKAAK